jgi:hypothetical protein
VVNSPQYYRAIKLLESDTAKHLATLKYLSLYGGDATVNILEEGKGWAVLALFPTTVLSFDREAYPRAKVAVFANGNNNQLKQQLLQSLPNNNYVLRLNEPLDLSGLEKRYQINRGFTYLSYSGTVLPKAPPAKAAPPQSELTPDAIALFKQNDYTENELRGYFTHGARWFGYIEDGVIKSICFVYQDYGKYREIAGVRTVDSERRKGYAKIVVYSALNYLLENGLVPRYVTELKNTNSIRLAESLGMKRFLRIEHFLLEPK